MPAKNPNPDRPVMVLRMNCTTADVLCGATRTTVPLVNLCPDYTGQPVRAGAWAVLTHKARKNPAACKPMKVKALPPPPPPPPSPAQVMRQRERDAANARRATAKARREAVRAAVVAAIQAAQAARKAVKFPKVLARKVVVPVAFDPSAKPLSFTVADERFARALAPETPAMQHAIMQGHNRKCEVIQARRRVWTRLRATGMSLEEAGAFTGHDHTTVMHGLQRGAEPDFMPMLAAIRTEAERERSGLFSRHRTSLIRRNQYAAAREQVYLRMWDLCRNYSIISRACGVPHNTVLTALRRSGVAVGECAHSRRGRSSYPHANQEAAAA